MEKITIKIKEEIYIDSPPEVVWDYTQDFSKRLEWDKYILSAKVIQESPVKMVKIKGKADFAATFVYKLYNRPHKTTLMFADIKSPFIIGGGGSWNYEKKSNGTQWTQLGSCILKNGIASKILMPFIKLSLRYYVRSAMNLAKKIIEGKK